MVTSLTRLFKSDWIQGLNVEGFLDHFTHDEMDIDVQKKWVDTQNHFIFMCDDQVSHVSFHFTWRLFYQHNCSLEFFIPYGLLTLYDKNGATKQSIDLIRLNSK